jgi:hypothetical protein
MNDNTKIDTIYQVSTILIILKNTNHFKPDVLFFSKITMILIIMTSHYTLKNQ